MNERHGGPSLDAALLDVLRTATATPDLAFESAPTRLTGGFWAELASFRLRGAPVGWRGPLVVRLMPDAATAAKEAVIQSEVAAQGFPTPAVHLAGGPDAGLGRAFFVMDLASGRPMLAGLDGPGVVAALPRLARSLPDTLAATAARLHRLDPSPVRDRLREAGVMAADTEGMLVSLADAAANAGRSDLTSVVRWLVEHPQEAEAEVVCHGDLHPFNVLVDDAGDVTVLDWSVGMLAPRSFDLAFTGVMLAEPPIPVPRALRPVLRAAGRALARRFRRTYEREAGTSIDPAQLAWHEGLVCLRALAEVAGWAVDGSIDDRAGHPWLISGSTLAVRLTKLTGVRVRPR